MSVPQAADVTRRVPPPIDGVVETSLYVEDLARATAFYRDVIGLRVLGESPRLVALDAGRRTVLLLFLRGATAAGAITPRGFIPPHDGSGPLHFALAVAVDTLEAWETHLAAHGLAIEGRVSWERGGRSLYFRDPDGHSVELATPGTWATY